VQTVWADTADNNHSRVRVELISSAASFTPGQTVPIAVRFSIDPHWHLYWLNPGDSGLAPQVKWTLPKGITISMLQFPVPSHIDAPGGLLTYGYENELVLLADMSVSADVKQAINIKAEIFWLVCKDVCLPEKSTVTLTLPLGNGAAQQTADFTAWRAKQPVREASIINNNAHATDAISALPTLRLVLHDKQSAELRVEGIDGYRVRDFFPPISSAMTFSTGSVVTQSGKSVYVIPVSLLSDLSSDVSSDELIQSPAVVVFENDMKQITAAELVCTVQNDGL
jgi:DsbC/DsbD-like thiol-disulfide interchange protein